MLEAVYQLSFFWLKVKKAQSKWIESKGEFNNFYNWQVQWGDWLNCCLT